MSEPLGRKHVLLSLAIMAGTAGLLRAMGRLPFCKCGMVGIWSGDIWSNQNSQQLADPYTFTHVVHGMLIYAVLWFLLRNRVGLPMRLVLAVALEAGWEMIENTDFVIQRYRDTTISLDYYGDSILNSMGDILAMAAGFGLASRLPARITLACAVALDLVLLLTIHDSLAVNIIMLIHPFEFIRHWQSWPR